MEGHVIENPTRTMCTQCMWNDNHPSVGSITLDAHIKTVTIDHVCLGTYGTFLDEIHDFILEHDDVQSFPFERLCITRLHSMGNDVAPYTEKRGSDYFKTLDVEHFQRLHDVFFFVENVRFAQCDLWSYENQTLSFKYITRLRDVCWSGWYSKWTNVRHLRIERCGSYMKRTSVGQLALTPGMERITSVHVALDPMNYDDDVPITIWDPQDLPDILIFLGLFAGNARDVALLRIPKGDILSVFLMLMGMTHTNRMMLSKVWPRLQRIETSTRSTPKGNVFEAIPNVCHVLLRGVPNLHTFIYNGKQSCLQSVRLQPTARLMGNVGGATHNHVARIRYRTHMAATVFNHAWHMLRNRDLARALTEHYLDVFYYPVDAPRAFLYPEGTVPLDQEHFMHLLGMYEQTHGASREDNIHVDTGIARCQDEIAALRIKLEDAREAFNSKIVGKRKRLYNAVDKLESSMEKLVAKRDRLQQKKENSVVVQRLAAQASTTYFETYIRNLLHLADPLVVDDKWGE